MALNEYFDKIIFINLARRPDRLEHALKEFEMHDITAERFEAIDMGDMANHGCTASHVAVLEMAIANGWNRTLILEDDVEFRFSNTQEVFSDMIGCVPEDWFMLYLGGHYAEKPQYRVNEHVIRIGRMKVTSSYAVTLEAAKKMAPIIKGGCQIDECYGQFHETENCYIFQPRIAVQYGSFSDIQRLHLNHRGCMEDTRHENMV